MNVLAEGLNNDRYRAARCSSNWLQQAGWVTSQGEGVFEYPTEVIRSTDCCFR